MNNPIQNQQGNTILYALFIAPIACALLIGGIDLAAWQQMRTDAQREADRLAFEAAYMLPYVDRVQALGTAHPNARIDVLPGMRGVRVEMLTTYEPSIAALLPSSSGGSFALPLDAVGTAELRPLDVAIVMSDGASMRPPALAPAWGSDSAWPPSDYFQFAVPPSISISPAPTEPRAWPSWWEPATFSSYNFQRWATSLCFNPVNDPLKRAVISVLDRMGASERSTVRVLGTPGDYGAIGGGFTVLDSETFASLATEDRDRETSSNTSWSSYFEPDSGLSDEACVLYSQVSNGGSRYSLPPRAGVGGEGCYPLSSIDAQEHYPSSARTQLAACYLQNAPLRDRVYFRAARQHSHAAQAENVLQAYHTAVSHVLTAQASDDVVNRRGALAPSARGVVILLVDALPSGLSESLNSLLENNSDLRTYIIAYQHSALSGAARAFNEQVLSSLYSISDDKILVRTASEENIGNVVRDILSLEVHVVLSS